MIALYRRQAKTAAELKLGWLKPLHEAIPELAKLASARSKAVKNGVVHATP